MKLTEGAHPHYQAYPSDTPSRNSIRRSHLDPIDSHPPSHLIAAPASHTSPPLRRRLLVVSHSAPQPGEVVGGGNARAGRQALCCSVGRADPHKLRCRRTPAYSDSSLGEHELTEVNARDWPREPEDRSFWGCDLRWTCRALYCEMPSLVLGLGLRGQRIGPLNLC